MAGGFGVQGVLSGGEVDSLAEIPLRDGSIGDVEVQLHPLHSNLEDACGRLDMTGRDIDVNLMRDPAAGWARFRVIMNQPERQSERNVVFVYGYCTLRW